MRRFSRLFFSDKTVIWDKVKESFASVLPIILIVFILSFTITPINSGVFLCFMMGSSLLVTGMGLFTLGADSAMTPIGEFVSSALLKTRKLWIIMPVYFIVGVLITMAEPDLQVLAGQLSETIKPFILLITVGVGVGIFLVIAFLRTVLNLKISVVLIISYVTVFILAFFVPNAFVPLSFDAGGVTTGPMSVPFIIAMGTGVSAIRSDKNAKTDGFGFTALCSIGPIISVMILGIIFNANGVHVTETVPQNFENSQRLVLFFFDLIPKYAQEVAIAILPIVVLFVLVRLAGSKLDRTKLIKIMVGIIYTYLGLVIFLIGANGGFIGIGYSIGKYIGELSFNWIIVPVGMLIGYFVVAAEPAVHVLTKQVSELTSNAVPRRALRISLMIGVSLSVGFAMLRILLHIPILYILIPAYVLAIILMFFVPEMFTAIAFDSGGVASGAMTASFLLPLAQGACIAVGGDIATEGFGIVAMVAMTPLITIQILGLAYKSKLKKLQKQQSEVSDNVEDIIE